VNAPHCPVHLGVEMQLEKSRLPLWLALGGGAHGNMTRERKRKIWRCRIKDCPRVMVHEPETDELAPRLCPRCGKASDATFEMRCHGSHKCRACLADLRGESAARRKLRLGRAA